MIKEINENSKIAKLLLLMKSFKQGIVEINFKNIL